jgi:hypothetical protein
MRQHISALVAAGLATALGVLSVPHAARFQGQPRPMTRIRLAFCRPIWTRRSQGFSGKFNTSSMKRLTNGEHCRSRTQEGYLPNCQRVARPRHLLPSARRESRRCPRPKGRSGCRTHLHRDRPSFPSLAGNPPTLQGSGYQAVEILGKLLNFDANMSLFRNEACGFATCRMSALADRYRPSI